MEEKESSNAHLKRTRDPFQKTLEKGGSFAAVAPALDAGTIKRAQHMCLARRRQCRLPTRPPPPPPTSSAELQGIRFVRV